MKIILSIDGGGIRGILPVTILEYLETKIQEIQDDNRIRIANLVDYIAGTGSGSIIASLMLLPQDCSPWAKYSMKEISEIYFKICNKSYRRENFYKIKTLNGLIGPKYPSVNIDEFLLKELDHFKLKDLIKPCLFTGYDLNTRTPQLYTNLDNDKKYEDYYIKDIIRGSMAIPSMFTPSIFREGINLNNIIWGGVFANNPSLLAYFESFKTIFNNVSKPLDPSKIILISIGSGAPKNIIDPIKWGKIKWVVPLLDIIMNASSEIIDYEIKSIFNFHERPDNYKRLNPSLKYSTSFFDDPTRKNMASLHKDAKIYIEQNSIALNLIAHEICDIGYFKLNDTI